MVQGFEKKAFVVAGEEDAALEMNALPSRPDASEAVRTTVYEVAELDDAHTVKGIEKGTEGCRHAVDIADYGDVFIQHEIVGIPTGSRILFMQSLYSQPHPTTVFHRKFGTRN